MSVFDNALTDLAAAAESVKTAIESSERAKQGLTLLKHTDLRRMGLGARDIRQIPQVWRKGAGTARYQARDVQAYLDSIKSKSKNRK